MIVLFGFVVAEYLENCGAIICVPLGSSRVAEMTAFITPSETTGKGCSNVGQIVAWILGLFALTFIGALPILLQGLNLTRISQSTPHLQLVLIGMLVTSCSPTLAALFVVGLYPNAGGLRSISRQVRTWRSRPIWYLIALIGPVILLLAARAINAARSGALPGHWMVLPSLAAPGGLAFVIFGSLFAEEPGWRGFAQPRLQVRYGALSSSIFIGLLWSTWHLWYVILPGGLSSVTGTDAAATYVRLTSTAVIYAWMYNSTHGSLFIAMIAHLGHNLAASLIPTPSDGGQQHLITALLYFVAATIVILTTDARTLRARAPIGLISDRRARR
jgi:membrane protease YdiL (CAAX protease family)